MKNTIKRIGVMTSGGDSPGMNAAIRAVARSCAYYHIQCVGFYRGFQGMIEGDFVEMDARSVRNIISRGGTILKSARSKEFLTKEGQLKALKQLKDHKIDGLIVIGGDGTFAGANGDVNWIAQSYFLDGISTLYTSLDLTAATGALGDIQVVSYLDEDVL